MSLELDAFETAATKSCQQMCRLGKLVRQLSLTHSSRLRMFTGVFYGSLSRLSCK
jgi:hypothetical protein